MRWDLVGSSLGDSPKESRSSLGTRKEIAGKKTGGLTVRLPEVARVCWTVANRCRRVNRPDAGWTARTTDYGRWPTADGG
ncbi:hypothetical protein BHM03_00057384 [Ensete ventricosum]|nr:hypothetical protein BHM03_00057384 [Ensete ventricosum]